MIKGIYKNTTNEIITGEGITRRFVTKRGLKQGCPMSTVLFDGYIDDRRRIGKEE